MAWLELVPNISEGRDAEAVRRVLGAFRLPGVHLLDVDGSRAAHRTVLTFAGEAEDLVEAAVAGGLAAAAHIDLRHHHGVHPRIGALDVCPFVPLGRDRSLDEAVAAARSTAERLGAHGVPAYLYGAAATREDRRTLAVVRRGQFEGLAARMPSDPPDFGPAAPHPAAGASAVGARSVLIAFNVNLDTRDVAVARRVARAVREWRTVRRDVAGHAVFRERGRLREVRAIGWFVEDFGCAQVSTNLTDYRVTPPHVLLGAVRQEAAALGAEVTGAELVGCIPLDALRAAALADGVQPGVTEAHVVDRGVAALGLDAVKSFDPSRKVLEWAVERVRAGGYEPWEEVSC